MFIFYIRSFTSKAVQYGKKNEDLARKQYEKCLGVKVLPTGLTLMPTHHYIGASADGIINSTIIEIKCPFRGENKSIDELIDSGYEHVERVGGKLMLKESSSYYSQVQGEMAIKG